MHWARKFFHAAAEEARSGPGCLALASAPWVLPSGPVLTGSPYAGAGPRHDVLVTCTVFVEREVILLGTGDHTVKII